MSPYINSAAPHGNDALGKGGNSSPGPDVIHCEKTPSSKSQRCTGFVQPVLVVRRGPTFLEESYNRSNSEEREATLRADNTAKLSANGFKISASKSRAVLFTNSSVKRSEANVRRYRQGSNPTVSDGHLLGIVLNAKLSWSAHAEAVRTRCMKCLDATKAISGSSWGANKSNLLQVYRATIRSLLDYG